MTKLIPHVLQPTAQAMSWAAASSVYKRLNYRAPIVRRYWPDTEQNDRIANMAVDATFNDIMAVVGPETKYVEVFNEVAQTQGAGLEQHADFLEAIVPRFHARGIQVAGFSFSTGNPRPEDFQYLYNRRWCGCDAVALHEYWGPKGFDQWYALRHRLLTAAVPAHPSIIVTECGRDAVEGGRRGWKSSGITANQYVAELKAYDAELQKDDYVLWAAVFTAGPTYDWINFTTDELPLQELGVMTTNPDGSVTISKDEWEQLATRVGALESRDALITAALRDVAMGKYQGAAGVAGLVVALQGGKDDVSGKVLPDVNP